MLQMNIAKAGFVWYTILVKVRRYAIKFLGIRKKDFLKEG